MEIINTESQKTIAWN